MSGLPERMPRPDMSEAAVRSALIGAWLLVDCTTYNPDGSTSKPFGPRGIGQIMYSADGRMSAHLAAPDRPATGTANYYDVAEPALAGLMRSYSGYWGRYSIDAAAGMVTHHVAGAWIPDFALVDQQRFYAFDGDLLYLEAPLGDGLARLTWRRAAAEAAATGASAAG